VRTADVYDEALRLAERYGDAASVRFIRGNRIWAQFMLGDWDRALKTANAFIEECEAGSPHILEGPVHDVRAAIRISRGDRDGALRDQLRALELARDRLDLFHRLGGIANTAVRYAELGRIEEARTLALETIPLVRETGVHGALIWLGLYADALGVAEDLRAASVLGTGPAVPFWRNAVVRTLDGELSAVSDQMAGAGNPTIEASLRMHAGLRLLSAGRTGEAQAELERALAFYRSVDASAYVAEIEAALAGDQRDSA
jgi:tetratricopeptide (TPR) repeat protein